MSKVRTAASILHLCFLYSVIIACFLQKDQVAAITDPTEVLVIRSLADKWNIRSSVTWNLSDPCSDPANSTADIGNPGIKCDCTEAICRVTEMRVNRQNIRGEFPAELSSLTRLMNLNLDKNHLTGPLPAFLGYLINMQYLSVAFNLLSGPIPKELGNLGNLILLNIGHNNLGGTVPPELGNLTKLEKLYINFAGVSGEIPSTFRNLQKLRNLSLSDNQFSGEIPDFIGNWTDLTLLNLDHNALSGPLPSFLGNLINMQDLRVAFNNLSGPIPKELGNLRNLIVLGIGHYSLGGTVPPDLGNLTKLEQLYIDFGGVIGEIPSTFRNLKKLQKLSLCGNQFTGEIPDFIGNWTDLTLLNLDRNNLTGPLPAFLGNLINMQYFVQKVAFNSLSGPVPKELGNLGNLIELSFGHNNLNGTIPLELGNLNKLEQLDLSFNNFTGEIPNALLNSSSLQYLFLGNNNLSGNLPPQKNSILQYVDLSYNRFSGAPPTWLNDGNSEVNLVGNYLEFNDADNRGLSCLQRTFPCSRGAPRYSDFAINCGGEQMTSAKGIVYERDDEKLDAASFYVSDTQRWGVSNIGKLMKTNNPSYIQTSQSQFTNTQDTKLYQTARLSPSSLRYYGLGLKNGTYTVNLQFGEIDTESWKSVGKRIFDVYVQGNKVITNFNIRKEAGSSNKVVERSLKANVTENFLEIHFFWAGKGYYGPLVSAISVTPDFTVTDISPYNTTRKKIKTGTVIGIVSGGMAAVLTCMTFIIFKWRKVQKASETGGEEHGAMKGMYAKPNVFSYADMKNATRDFHEENKLGQGGFGTVYKGILPDDKVIAVKLLSAESKQGMHDFINEVAAISAVQHRNLVKLHGYCLEGEHRLLVYEYLENNSLAHALFDKKSNIQLDWPTRYNICVGTARGLAYLHEESSIRIVHRDIKASNILLDNSLNPKIADFGLAKVYDATKTHISTGVAGTIGYLSPEYALRGYLTEKVDVFSFGVLALELVSGRSNTETSLTEERVYLLEWAWHLHEQDQLLDLVDPLLTSTYSKEEGLRIISVALLCTQALPAMRPSMSRVVAMLIGDVAEIPVASRPSYIIDNLIGD